MGHDENVQLFMTKTGMSNNDYVQKVSERQAHVQVGYVQVGYVQVKFVTLLDISNSSALSFSRRPTTDEKNEFTLSFQYRPTKDDRRTTK